MLIKLNIEADAENAKTIKRLKGAPKEALDVISKLIAKAALNISNDAKRRIAKGPKTGRIYYYATGGLPGEAEFIKRGKPHRASAPGESPATDTGALMNSIITRSKELVTEAGTDIKYAPGLEFGTENIEPRPFLQPAIDEVWPDEWKEITAAVQRAIEA
jgi:phage gpG-like protein